MPTQIRDPLLSIVDAATTPDASPPSITPLAIIAIVAFVLHLAAGAVLDRSHARQLAPVAGGGPICCAEAMPPEPVLPYD
jgi:hypothetical protein